MKKNSESMQTIYLRARMEGSFLIGLKAAATMQIFLSPNAELNPELKSHPFLMKQPAFFSGILRNNSNAAIFL